MSEALPHILVVDDDREIGALLSKFLDRHGVQVTTALDGREMFTALDSNRIDLVVLDLMLPGEDGLALCRRLRKEREALPVIMLTAMGEEVDRIIGLEMGADDYLPKPFNPRELLARIKAVLRRSDRSTRAEQEVTAADRVLSFDRWRLSLGRRELSTVDGEVVALSSGEFYLLRALAERPQRVLTREQLLDLTKSRATAVYDRSIDIQIMRLRRKIEHDPSDPQLIKTVRSGGYIMAAPVRIAGDPA